MPVHLKDNWREPNSKTMHRGYNLGRHNEKVIDETMNKLHAENKINRQKALHHLIRQSSLQAKRSQARFLPRNGR